MVLVDERGRPFAEGKVPTTDADIRKALANSSPFYHAATVIRRSALEAVGGYRPAFEPSEDYDLWLRLSERYRLANLSEFVGQYRHHLRQESVVLAGIRGAAARVSARDRRRGRPDRFATAKVIDEDVALAAGVDRQELTESIVRYAVWLAETSSRAGHATVAASLWELAASHARSPSGSPELREEVDRRARAARRSLARDLGRYVRSSLSRARADPRSTQLRGR